MASPTGIVTPEAVVLEFETAALPSRMLAALVDAAIQLAILFAVLFAAFGLNEAGIELGGVANAFLYVVVFLLVFGYPAGFETLWHGRTPGKAALGLRVVTAEGAPIRFRHAAIRAILGLVDKYLVPFAGVPGVLALLATSRNQRLGDLVAGTIVLRERSAAKAPTAVAFAPPRGLEAYTASLDVAALDRADYVAVRSFLLRAPSLAPAARDPLARQLATPLVARLRTTPPAGVPAEVFLVCVAAAHQHRYAPAPTAWGGTPAFASVWADPAVAPGPPVPLPVPPPASVTSGGGFTAPG
jgi:uncharacterized RDD family membrane protein YckC